MGIECAVIAAIASGYSAQQQTKACQQRLGETYSDPILAKRRAVDGKCPCCGSRQFVDHHARRICAYCRSEQ